MKDVENLKYFDCVEIAEMFSGGETPESIRKHFETNKLKGKKINGEWYATKENIEKLIEQLENISIAFTDPQKIDLRHTELKGRILDIGGGGEGVIGQLKGSSVVAIDIRKSELIESFEAGDENSLKIIMDAKDLKFLDNTFDSVTAFFSLMYIPKKDHEKVLKEIYRVLKTNGDFLLWDLIIPRNTRNKLIYAIPIKIQIENKEIVTGYGTRWNKEQTPEYFIKLTREVGFKFSEQRVEEDHFFLKFKKN